MQTANIHLALGGDMGNIVPKYGVTVAEVAVLRFIHGEGAVHNVTLAGEVKRTHRQEIGRLSETYGKWEGEKRVSPAVEALFPGAAARVFETFDELELPEDLYSAEARKSLNAAPREQAPAKGGKSVDDMTKPELENYAVKHSIDLTGVTKKADILDAIKLHEADKAAAEDDEDDEVGEINDGIDANNGMFE